MDDLSRDARAALAETVAWLGTDEAERAIERNCYWPKWDGAWWRMTLLWEMGRADLIPERALSATWRAVKTRLLTFFPIRAGELPVGKDPFLDVPCHCQLGTIYQVLHARGVPLDAEAPWIRAWFLRYQMPNGALNCDEGAYLADPPRSSIVGTIASLEAVLRSTDRPFTGALPRPRGGEPDRAPARARARPERGRGRGGLGAALLPAVLLLRRAPRARVARGVGRSARAAPAGGGDGEVVRAIAARFPDGRLRSERLSYERVPTLRPADGAERSGWARGPAATFWLLDEVSRVGVESSLLSARWRAARAPLERGRA